MDLVFYNMETDEIFIYKPRSVVKVWFYTTSDESIAKRVKLTYDLSIEEPTSVFLGILDHTQVAFPHRHKGV